MKQLKARTIDSSDSLQRLNDDCLELVCASLSLIDQYSMLTLNERFANVVMGLWRRQYTHRLDFAKETQLKLLPCAELRRLLECIAVWPSELLNVNAHIWQALTRIVKGSKQCYDNIRKITFATTKQQHHHHHHHEKQQQQQQQQQHEQCRSLEVLRDFCNLSELHICPGQLANDSDDDEYKFVTIFRHIPLRAFVCLPDDNDTETCHLCNNNNNKSNFLRHLPNLKYCHTLRVLQLSVQDLSGHAASLTALAALPQLLQLTVHSTPSMSSQRIDAVHTRLIEALQSCPAKWQGMRALQWRCHITRHFPRLFRGLTQLRCFAWHSHLHVQQRQDGGLQWDTMDMQVGDEVIAMITAGCPNLRNIDFRWNYHVDAAMVQRIRTLLSGRQLPHGESIRFAHGDGRTAGTTQTQRGFIAFEFGERRTHI